MTQNFNSSHEGELFKYANLIKGYQKRYFAINPATSELNYYSSGKLRHRQPKGTIKLANAVILPSENEETTFTIHAFENNKHQVSYLKASSTRERMEWMNALKKNLHSESSKNQRDQDVASCSASSAVNQCCICLDNAKQAVVTLCGHLFCKMCIHQWIEMKPTGQTCPVCSKSVNKQKIVRLYGVDEEIDPAETNLSNSNENTNLEDLTQSLNQDELFEIQASYIAEQERGLRQGTNFLVHASNRTLDFIRDTALAVIGGLSSLLAEIMPLPRPVPQENVSCFMKDFERKMKYCSIIEFIFMLVIDASSAYFKHNIFSILVRYDFPGHRRFLLGGHNNYGIYVVT